MDDVSVNEARRNFKEILDRVMVGEEITIARHGRPIAMIVPVNPRRRRLPDPEYSADNPRNCRNSRLYPKHKPTHTSHRNSLRRKDRCPRYRNQDWRTVRPNPSSE